MSLFLLDSDTLSLLENNHAEVSARVVNCRDDEITVSVITVEEALRGWFTMVRKAKNVKRLAAAYERLASSVTFLSNFRILSFDENAIAEYQQLVKSRLHVGANDLRIAAIAQVNNATVVTRNVQDFR